MCFRSNDDRFSEICSTEKLFIVPYITELKYVYKWGNRTEQRGRKFFYSLYGRNSVVALSYSFTSSIVPTIHKSSVREILLSPEDFTLKVHAESLTRRPNQWGNMQSVDNSSEDSDRRCTLSARGIILAKAQTFWGLLLHLVTDELGWYVRIVNLIIRARTPFAVESHNRTIYRELLSANSVIKVIGRRKMVTPVSLPHLIC